MDCFSLYLFKCDLPIPLAEVLEDHHVQANLPHHPQVLSSVGISTVRDRPSSLQQEAGTLEALVHLGHTLEGAYFADRILTVGKRIALVLAGTNRSTPPGSHSREGIFLVAASSEATVDR